MCKNGDEKGDKPSGKKRSAKNPPVTKANATVHVSREMLNVHFLERKLDILNAKAVDHQDPYNDWDFRIIDKKWIYIFMLTDDEKYHLYLEIYATRNADGLDSYQMVGGGKSATVTDIAATAPQRWIEIPNETEMHFCLSKIRLPKNRQNEVLYELNQNKRSKRLLKLTIDRRAYSDSKSDGTSTGGLMENKVYYENPGTHWLKAEYESLERKYPHKKELLALAAKRVGNRSLLILLQDHLDELWDLKETLIHTRDSLNELIYEKLPALENGVPEFSSRLAMIHLLKGLSELPEVRECLNIKKLNEDVKNLYNPVEKLSTECKRLIRVQKKLEEYIKHDLDQRVVEGIVRDYLLNDDKREELRKWYTEFLSRIGESVVLRNQLLDDFNKTKNSNSETLMAFLYDDSWGKESVEIVLSVIALVGPAVPLALHKSPDKGKASMEALKQFLKHHSQDKSFAFDVDTVKGKTLEGKIANGVGRFEAVASSANFLWNVYGLIDDFHEGSPRKHFENASELSSNICKLMCDYKILETGGSAIAMVNRVGTVFDMLSYGSKAIHFSEVEDWDAFAGAAAVTTGAGVLLVTSFLFSGSALVPLVFAFVGTLMCTGGKIVMTLAEDSDFKRMLERCHWGTKAIEKGNLILDRRTISGWGNNIALQHKALSLLIEAK